MDGEENFDQIRAQGVEENYDVPALKAKLLELLGPDLAHAYPYALELKFPRILDRIVELWGKPALDEFLEQLMVTNRSGRKGFPYDVAMEIFRLSTTHGALGLSPNDSLGTGWDWIEDPELFKRGDLLKGGS